MLLVLLQSRFYQLKGFEVSLQSKYVGDQYLDNTGNEGRNWKLISRRISGLFIHSVKKLLKILV